MFKLAARRGLSSALRVQVSFVVPSHVDFTGLAMTELVFDELKSDADLVEI